MSRKTQRQYLFHLFGKPITTFMTHQLRIPQQWVRLLRILDEDHKAWTLRIESQSPNVHYSVLLKHTTLRERWNLEVLFDVQGEDHCIHSKRFMKSMTDATLFYTYVLFILVRLPKRAVVITSFMVGRRTLLEMKVGWRMGCVETLVHDLEIDRSRFERTRTGVTLSRGVDTDPLLEWLNTKNKRTLID